MRMTIRPIAGDTVIRRNSATYSLVAHHSLIAPNGLTNSYYEINAMLGAQGGPLLNVHSFNVYE
jgi:hypothetical protein